MQRFKVESAAREPTIIIFAIGINDSQYIKSKNNPQVPLTIFQNNVNTLIDQARKFTPSIIFIGLTQVDETKTMPIPWNEIAFYDNKNVAQYNDILKKVCHNEKLLFIEMGNLLNPAELDDGLHPNSKGHQKMFERVKNFLVHEGIL